MTNQPSSQSRAWTVGEAKERLPEILRLAETEGPQRIVANRTFVVAPAEASAGVSEESAEPFETDEAAELLRMDAAHNPVLADYWRDDSDDDLIANP